jgi:hypothetical protein
MRKPVCYGLTVLRHSLDSLEANGEFDTSRINRRALLFHSGSAVVASTVAATAFGKEPPGEDPEPSTKLRTLIDVHKAAYAAFGKALHEIGGARSDSARASREEERALLAICSYAAGGEGDRLAKALYLLEIEARGELELAEHMQAIVRSTTWRG